MSPPDATSLELPAPLPGAMLLSFRLHVLICLVSSPLSVCPRGQRQVCLLSTGARCLEHWRCSNTGGMNEPLEGDPGLAGGETTARLQNGEREKERE